MNRLSVSDAREFMRGIMESEPFCTCRFVAMGQPRIRINRIGFDKVKNYDTIPLDSTPYELKTDWNVVQFPRQAGNAVAAQLHAELGGGEMPDKHHIVGFWREVELIDGGVRILAGRTTE